MNTTFTIGSLAQAADVPVSTLRFYERKRLLIPSRRTGSNYRLYDDADLDRLLFIKAAQSTGFTLKDIGVLLGLENDTTQVCEEVQELIVHRLADVAARMKDLKHVQKVLRASLERCRSGSGKSHCKVIEDLSEKRA